MTSVLAAAGSPPSLLAQVAYLALALGLTAAIGMDRQIRDKSAGLRTHSVIGLGAALFVLLSKYGFHDVLAVQRVVLDPSRVAAQIASGIGFVGAGLIFVRRGDVKGLTSAASVWLTAAIGAAAGAGLVAAALLGTGGYFLVAVVLTSLERRLQEWRSRALELEISYRPGSGVLSRTFELCEDQGFRRVASTWPGGLGPEKDDSRERGTPPLRSRLVLRGREPADTLVALLNDLPGMETVSVRPPPGSPGKGTFPPDVE